LTIGTAYFVRVYSYLSFQPVNFTICIATPPNPPANDDCADAINLNINPALSCTNTTAGTTSGATASNRNY